MTKSRFDGTRCEHCRGELLFSKPPVSGRPPGLTVTRGEEVDVAHLPPWCERWRNPMTRMSCVPKAILDACEREEPS